MQCGDGASGRHLASYVLCKMYKELRVVQVNLELTTTFPRFLSFPQRDRLLNQRVSWKMKRAWNNLELHKVRFNARVSLNFL